MKQLIIETLAVLIWCIALWVIASFIAWDINPAHWHILLRAGCFIALCLFFLLMKASQYRKNAAAEFEQDRQVSRQAFRYFANGREREIINTSQPEQRP